MSSRAEIARKYARAYAKASKKDKGVLLAEVVAVTGWSRIMRGGGWPRRPGRARGR